LQIDGLFNFIWTEKRSEISMLNVI